MRSISGVLATAVLSLPMLGLVGCSEDNEAAIKTQAAANAGKDDGSASPANAPTTQEEYAAQQKKRMQSQKSDLKNAGYPAPKR